MKRLESRFAALEERTSKRWFVRAAKRLNESEDEAIDRAMMESGLERAYIAHIELWYERPPTPSLDDEDAYERWCDPLEDYPIARQIALLPHKGVETLRGYEPIVEVFKRLAKEEHQRLQQGFQTPKPRTDNS